MTKKLIAAVASTFLLTACLDTIENVDFTCSTEALEDGSGAKIVCNGDSIGVVMNGLDGADGKNGANGKDGKNGKNGVDGSSCEMQPLKKGDGFKIVCDGDSVGVLFNGIDGKDGADGKNGKDGTDGKNGKSCVAVDTLDAVTGKKGVSFECDGEEPVVVWDGKDGANGKDGSNGTSCTTKANAAGNGYDVMCGGKKVGEILNGKDGKDGSNGTSCTTKANAAGNGYDVICDGEKVGEILNGKNGNNAENGSSCTMEANAAGNGYDVICDGEKVGEIHDGKDGKDGASCTMEANAAGNGFDVICDGEKVGEIHDGKDGKDGTSCTMEANAAGNGYDVICDGEKVGEVLNGKDGEKGTGCTAEAVTDEETGRNGVAITCGENSEPVYIWDGKDAEELSLECLEMRATKTAFFPIQDVFGCVKSNEKVVFIVRHAERNKDDTGSEKSLNSNGFSQANYVGQNISKLNLDEDIYYWHTGARRTMETASEISKGAGESNFFDEKSFDNCNSGNGKNENTNCINEHHEYNNDMVGSWYEECEGEGDGWKTYAKAAYAPEQCGNNPKPDVVARTNEFVKTYIKDKFDNLHKYTIAISHDQFLVSAVAAISNKQIDFKFHEHGWGQTGFVHWPNYLAGFAVIINEAKEVVYIPVRGLNSGYFGDHCKTGSEVGYPCSVWP